MTKKLTASFVRTAKPGKYYDLHGLALRVIPSGRRQWIQRLTVHGRRRDIGLGGYPYVSLAQAREKAFLNRQLAREGGDPFALKQRPDIPTFAEAVEQVLELHRPGWKDKQSESQWRGSLKNYALPRLGSRRVSDINSADVMAVLLPIWHKRPETARRVRQRLSVIFKWAIAQSFRRDDPAGDAIAQALPKQNGKRGHFKALPWGEVSKALATVRKTGAWAGTRYAIEFLILTAARSGEVREAKWSEIDFETATWTIDGSRMKGGRTHRVPLSRAALAVLKQAAEIHDGSGLIFPSTRGGPISNFTMSKLLRENQVACVPHGFRSSFRDWAGETGVPREVAEAALAHAIKNQAEAAYARSDLLERRRELMEKWAFTVVPLR